MDTLFHVNFKLEMAQPPLPKTNNKLSCILCKFFVDIF